MNDNRTSGGVPEGGQFAAAAHAESPVKLFDRNDGSFFKPSPSSTAEHCLNFWSNIVIPDEIISQAESVYHETRTAEVEAGFKQRVDDWKTNWVVENPKPRFKLEAWEEKFQAELAPFKNQVREDLTNERPMWLGTYDSRQLVRAAQMLFHAPHAHRFPDENIKVRDHEIELFTETLTVEEIQAKYKLYQIHHALEKVFEDTTEKEMLQVMKNLGESMNIVSEEVIDARRDSMI
ncbi:MAG TPA: hypothetical protein VF867_10035 [Arthrobacter sp.]